ncbi:hypothetical protein ADK86_19500 [Streptomyces sp. NRRL F-5755]|nr:hypothetical protein ADK86_19500 [Streptomyces sp. NRRL F-5755]
MPIRARTALAAGLAALLLAAVGAWWLRQHVYDSRMAASQDQALAQARAIARDNAADQGGSTITHGDTVGLPFVVLDPRGVPVLRGEPLKGVKFAGKPLTPTPRTAAPSWHTVRTVRTRPGPPGDTNRMHGRTFTAVGVFSYVPSHDPTKGRSYFEVDGNYAVYVLVTPFDAENTVRALDPILYASVPGAALLITALAWTTTRRALRPVEAIRAELAEISEQHLDRRVPVPRAKDEIARMAVTTNDTLDRLQRSAEQQRRFVADASHELRSPISALRASLEISLAHPDRTDWPRATREALESAGRLQQLADDLLFLARPDDDRSDAMNKPVNLTDLARDLVTEMRHTRPEGPEIVMCAHEPGGDRILVSGNAGQLRRLLRNLLDNAARHARSVVKVTTFTCTEAGAGASTVGIEVHNDGSDIPPADRERIFERFTRLDEARSRDAGGSGLGLAIARAIAQHHGGSLTVRDTPPGTGAAFVAELPSHQAFHGPPPLRTC